MPHFKCVPCRARFSAGDRAELVHEVCPECGYLLEPVGDLTEVVGFRMTEPERWDDPAGLSRDAVALAAALLPPAAGNELVLTPPTTTDRRPQ